MVGKKGTGIKNDNFHTKKRAGSRDRIRFFTQMNMLFLGLYWFLTLG
jgi:hypothetical protein